MTLPPLWLLDVDGVLNASRAGWHAAPTSRTVAGYRLRWSPDCTARIRALHLAGRVEIRWSTSWVGNVIELEAALALPTFPLAFPTAAVDAAAAGEALSPGQRWLAVLAAKHEAALNAVRAGRRVIWTDDDAVREMRMLAPGDLATIEAAGALVIEPRSSLGLRPEHLDAVEAFCPPRPPGLDRPEPVCAECRHFLRDPDHHCPACQVHHLKAEARTVIHRHAIAEETRPR